MCRDSKAELHDYLILQFIKCLISKTDSVTEQCMKCLKITKSTQYADIPPPTTPPPNTNTGPELLPTLCFITISKGFSIIVIVIITFVSYVIGNHYIDDVF